MVGAMWQTEKTGRDGGDRPITRGPAPRAAHDGYTPLSHSMGLLPRTKPGLLVGSAIDSARRW